MSVNINFDINLTCDICGQTIYGDGLLSVFYENNSLTFYYSTTNDFEELAKDQYLTKSQNNINLDEKIIHDRFTCIQDYLKSLAVPIHDWKERAKVNESTETEEIELPEFAKPEIRVSQNASVENEQEIVAGGVGVGDEFVF